MFKQIKMSNLKWYINHLSGFIPPPLIFGTGIDSTCLFWSTECGVKGACLLYDNVSYRHLYISMAIVLKVMAFLLYTTTWLCLRRDFKKYIKNNEGYITPTEMFSSSVNLDSLGKGQQSEPSHRTKFIYSLEDHEWCENMESVYSGFMLIQASFYWIIVSYSRMCETVVVLYCKLLQTLLLGPSCFYKYVQRCFSIASKML